MTIGRQALPKLNLGPAVSPSSYSFSPTFWLLLPHSLSVVGPRVVA